MPLDHTHQHSSLDIMQALQPHLPIDSTAGFRPIGPFTVSFDAADFVNPSDNGIATLAIPAGSMVLDIIPITTIAWKATGNVDLDQHDALYASVLTAANG